jgi:hypothetical protein
MWGVEDYFGRPKPSYPAVVHVLTTMRNAYETGRISTPDAAERLHVFSKDGEAFVVAWRAVPLNREEKGVAATSRASLACSGPSARVRDIYGRERVIETGSDRAVQVELSGAPQYVYDVGERLVRDAALTLLEQKRARVRECFATLAEQTEADPHARSFEMAHASAGETLRDERDVSGAALAEHTLAVYAAMQGLAQACPNEQDARTSAFVALEAMYNYAAALGRIYQHFVPDDAETVPADRAVVLAGRSTAAYRAKLGADGLLPVSTAAVTRLRRYARLARQHDQQDRPAPAAMYALHVRGFAPVVEAMVEAEPLKRFYSQGDAHRDD